MWTWVIVIGVALLGVGLVLSQLFRLKDWLKNAPPVAPTELPEPPADDEIR
jgi:hypothetical protein